MQETDPGMGSDLERAGETARERRNDRISPLAVIALVAFWALQSSFLEFSKNSRNHAIVTIRNADSPSDGAMPSAVETGLLTIDLEAKASYIEISKPEKHPRSKDESASKLGAMVESGVAGNRRTACRTAMDLLRRYPDQPALARRVILLRAETGDTNPLGPLPPATGRSAKVILPLSAFASDKNSSAPVNADIAAESAIWSELFGGHGRLSPAEAASLADRVRADSYMRWWRSVALHQIYVRAGLPASAKASLASADSEARKSVLLTEMLNLTAIGFSLVGLIALAILVNRALSARAPDESAADRSGEERGATRPGQAVSLFEPTPPRVRDDDRKLGAGDLANLFALYLVLMIGMQILAPHLLGGILGEDPRHPLSESGQIANVIWAEAAATALCGLLLLGATFWLAAIRKANLGDEIGLNLGAENIGRVVLFGMVGWSVSIPLVIGLGLLSQRIFHDAPSPANPAIPLLMSTPGGQSAVVLFVLVAVLAPLFEETVFRGLFYNAARLRLGAPTAIGLTGIAFGLAHAVGIAEQVPLAVLGCVLAWMAQTRKSLLPGMIAHSLQNSFSYALLLFSLMTIVPR
jgi:membrane protease YdiL (CAAX protease family)